MTVDDPADRVVICSSGKLSLSADDTGLTLRNDLGRLHFFSWPEISSFADGRYPVSESRARWVLDIVLRSGQTYSVRCTIAVSATPKTLAAVRQVAERYGIPAELTGIMMVADGRPDGKGLYEDPWGQAGVRYWDGKQWSPLLPADHGMSMPVWKSTALWTELPAAQVPLGLPRSPGSVYEDPGRRLGGPDGRLARGGANNRHAGALV